MSNHRNLFLVLIFALCFNVAVTPVSAATPSVPSDAFVQLDSMSYSQVCGLTAAGTTKCVSRSTDPIQIPDAVGKFSDAFSNNIASCGLDLDGVKCWVLADNSQTINSKPILPEIRSFLKTVRTDSVRLGARTFCGVDAANGHVRCLVPYWSREPRQTIDVQPLEPVLALETDDANICWAEGTPQFGTVQCKTNSYRAPAWPAHMGLAGLTELAVGQNYVCARSASEAKCWTPTKEIVLTNDFITALKWVGDSGALCALTQDHRIQCVSPFDGTEPGTHRIPYDYQTSNPKLKDLWVTTEMACATLDAGEVSCWSWWATSPSKVAFSRPVVKLFGRAYTPCGLMDNGQVECRYDSISSRTLANSDYIRVAFSDYGNCFWNSSGVDCRERYEQLNYRSVKAVAGGGDQTVCIVGVGSDDPADVDRVQCLSYDQAMKAPPIELHNPTHIAAASNHACAISDEGVTCWGAPLTGTDLPVSTVLPKRLVMGSEHACLVDRFGLACWGDLDNRGLQVPVGLNQPGQITDVAVGPDSTCVILKNGTAQCWGQILSTAQIPTLVGATSIVGAGSSSNAFCALDSTGVHCWGSSYLPY